MAALNPTVANASEILATASNCMLCHAVDKKLIGPSFKTIASRYGGNQDKLDAVAIKIRQGSHGEWGALPMPPNPQVTDKDAKALAAWILESK